MKNRPGPRRLLYIALLMISLPLAGCAAGYSTFHTENWDSTQPTPDLSNVKISCYDGKYPSQCSSIERVLQSRFHLLDVHTIPRVIRNETERFVISAESAHDMSQISTAWILVSFFTFAAIPAVWDQDSSLAFTVIAPGGEEKTFRYHYTERCYSWLPFVFFGPGFLMSANGGTDYYKEDRARIRDDITARFIMEAAPFLLSHTTGTAKTTTL